MANPSKIDDRRRQFTPLVAAAFIELGYRGTTTAELAQRCGDGVGGWGWAEVEGDGVGSVGRTDQGWMDGPDGKLVAFCVIF